MPSEHLSPDSLLLEVQRLSQELEQVNQEKAKLLFETQALIRRNNLLLADFLEAMPMGVAVLDTAGKLFYMNQRARALLGNHINSFMTYRNLPEVWQLYIAGTNTPYPWDNLTLVRALRGESTTLNNLEIRRGEHQIFIESWGTPIRDERGQIIYALAAFQDITRRKQAESESKEFTYQLYQLQEAFSRFVPTEFLRCLNKESIIDVNLGDHVAQEMSILFADIRDFTSLSEKMSSEDNFRFINAYLSRMEPAILENKGFIDKYIGDAIMALFDRSADDAIRAALAMLKMLGEYNQTRQKPERSPLKIGIGINTGSLMLGTVGGHLRMDSTVIGDAVNLAARLERLTKKYQVSLLISHHTFSQLEDMNHYSFRIIDRLQVRGKKTPVSVYEFFDADPPHILEKKLATKIFFEQALLLYHLKKFESAALLLQDCLTQNPEDNVAQIYLQRCLKNAELKELN